MRGLDFDPSKLVSLTSLRYSMSFCDIDGLENVDGQSGLGSMVILTQAAPRESGQDVYSRVFGPDIGVPEDPVVSLFLNQS